MRALPTFLASLTLTTLCAQAPPPLAEKIVHEGLENSQVMAFQDVLCHDFGSRLTGSVAFDRAAHWARDEFAAMGLDARLEPWGEWQVSWDREQWMGRVVEPVGLELQVASPAWTGSTRGIARGSLVRMPKTAEELAALQARAAQDPALWVWGAMSRQAGDAAVRDGVQALLDEGKLLGIAQSATSTRWNDKNWENQIRVFGDSRRAQRPYEERPRWANAVVRDDQSAQLEELLGGDKPVVVEFELRNRWRPGPVTLYNVVADLKGTTDPEDMVIVCAHLDSWHQATGATDNGTGTCSTLEAARILTAAGARPRRTIRFILWGGEEQGLLGSRQYVVQHRTQMHHVSAVFNHDSGTNWAQSLGIAESQLADFTAVVQPILDRMQAPQTGFEGPVFALRASKVVQPAGGGSDNASFAAVGVPAYGWGMKGEVPYARGWHSQWDTISIVVPQYQRQTATVAALVAFGVADLDHNLSRDGVERAQPGGLVNAQLIVETWLGVELDGLTITSVANGGLAVGAGLQKGDRLLAAGATAIDDLPGFLAALRALAGDGKPLAVTVQRGDGPVEVVLGGK
ncbi:MAG: M20/M25/M40 family metallo-hydrolase [Planctomycetes bacterium]|nr:M20/M25/M40 family metallo-hydrolase [Planctomycetota bacterium]MCB9885323.1 M20/M25/M40 family metallo-hydrolase [Planctomycetota bacterium]